VLDQPPDLRNHLLTTVKDVAPHTVEGLERTLHRFFSDPQAGLGELLAARTVIQRYGGRDLRLGLLTHRQVGGRNIWREFDINAMINGRRVQVEVKTNLNQAYRPSFAKRQIIKDLVEHAPQQYNSLIYLYHPHVAANLESLVRKRMLKLIDAAIQNPNHRLARDFQAKGLNLTQARQDLANWLPTGVTTYDRF
jgi:hypothetical protein